jgi:LppP/LprE lipoprotein
VFLFRCLRSLVPALAAGALLALALTGCGGAVHRSATTRIAKAPPPNPRAPLSQEAAEQMLRPLGYSGIWGRGSFPPRQPLKVIVGIREEAADVPGQHAFFFVGDRFVGTDTPDMSAEIFVVARGPDWVTLSYVLYKPDDGMSTPHGGRARVTYRWDGRRIVAEDPIPSAVWGAALSRR